MAGKTPRLRRRAFVVMPFGRKEVPKKPRIDSPLEPEATSETLKVDFDAVYQNLFQPVLEAAGLQPFRADDEEAAGDIIRSMFNQVQLFQLLAYKPETVESVAALLQKAP